MCHAEDRHEVLAASTQRIYMVAILRPQPSAAPRVCLLSFCCLSACVEVYLADLRCLRRP